MKTVRFGPKQGVSGGIEGSYQTRVPKLTSRLGFNTTSRHLKSIQNLLSLCQQMPKRDHTS